jgi:hypothetical protein
MATERSPGREPGDQAILEFQEPSKRATEWSVELHTAIYVAPPGL